MDYIWFAGFSAVITAVVCLNKNYNPVEGFFIGLIFGPLGVLIAIFALEKRPQEELVEEILSNKANQRYLTRKIEKILTKQETLLSSVVQGAKYSANKNLLDNSKKSWNKEIDLSVIPKGTTDYELLDILKNSYPHSTKQATTLLTTAERLMEGGGFSTSESKKIKKAQTQVDNLKYALMKNNFSDSFLVNTGLIEHLAKNGISINLLQKTMQIKTSENFSYEYIIDDKSEEAVMFIFMNLIAQTFPNWKPEYNYLNKFIPICLLPNP